ncbi:prion-inhibition and propagation-domain-containing protein [Pestalotiopsis sp. NC0098]|nr:prion-inhibition and propagation-domain-containing protein [Pestalotiopsis sp. NC0098]
MEVAGLSLGAVSLLFQVFSGCVKGYQLFSEAKGLEKRHQFFRVRFLTEQYRLLDWATIVGLDEHDEKLVISQINRSLVLDILDQQSKLMLRYGRIDTRLKPFTKPWIFEEHGSGSTTSRGEFESSADVQELRSRFPHTNPLLQKALKHIDATARYPARLRWAISDKEKLEAILGDLTRLNDSLHQLLTSQQLQSLNDHHIRTHYQIVQLHNKMDNLYELIQACSVLNLSGRQSLTAPSEHDGEFSLADLARFKALRSAIDTDSLTTRLREDYGLVLSSAQNQSLRIATSDLEIIETTEVCDELRMPAFLRRDADTSNPPSKVWIEWTATKAPSKSEPMILKRFEALVRLLREHRYTASFRSLKCHGYTERQCSNSEVQYGLVFDSPAEASREQPVSLMHLITSIRAPSLTSRLELIKILAEIIEKLHAVNWLHKGLRSQNIIFFHGPDGTIDITKPYLSGFEYSRPESANYMSENPPAMMAEDLYRHPAVQGGPREDEHGFGYKKHHDIYSLGIVFLELACWRPIYDVLGFDAAHIIKPSEAANAKETLLNGKFHKDVQSHMGNVVAEVWRACLIGPSALGMEDRNMSDAQLSVRLQEQFFNVVVERLQQIRI